MSLHRQALVWLKEIERTNWQEWNVNNTKYQDKNNLQKQKVILRPKKGRELTRAFIKHWTCSLILIIPFLY